MDFPNETSFTASRSLRILGFVLLIGGLLSYAAFQARNVLRGPELRLLTEPALMQEDRTVTLTGAAQNVVSLTLNGLPIFTDEAGHFTRALVLENGYTIMTLHATDRFGRHTSLKRSFVYQP